MSASATASAAAAVKPGDYPGNELAGFNRAEFDDTCARRFFYGPSFDAYGGTSGLFDLGPTLCCMKTNFLQQWRQHFVIEEQMCEVDCPAVTPGEVFKTSGHLQRFNDIMVRDTKSGECIRLDKHIEQWCKEKIKDKKTAKDDIPKLEKLMSMAEALDIDELKAAIAEFGITSMAGNPLSDPFPFNLMFKSQIGPEGNKDGYMRPELAQGIILNFKRLLDSANAQRIPFAAACVGQAYRNEIAPRNSLLRVREFTLAEIEHFINPEEKAHPKFSTVEDIKIWALDQKQQLESAKPEPTLRSLRELVDSKKIDNETLAYFIGRTALFLEKVGIRHVRFRQHKPKEMAHYAQDCWDAECLTSYGWFECVGLADRSAYDLTLHIKETKREMYGRVDYLEPKMVEVVKKTIDKRAAGKAYAKEMPAVVGFVEALPDDQAMAIGTELKEKGLCTVNIPALGRDVSLDGKIFQIERATEKKTGHNFVPSVVEPSFGVGRLLYAILEQNYWIRRDEKKDEEAEAAPAADKKGGDKKKENKTKADKNEKRAVFSLPPTIAPQKVAVFPLMMKPELDTKAREITKDLVQNGVSCRTDDSGVAIGRKYARVDELGIPFCITVDYQTVKKEEAGFDDAVTLRDRDSAKQVRVPVKEVAQVVADMCRPVAPREWATVAASYPEQKQ